MKRDVAPPRSLAELYARWWPYTRKVARRFLHTDADAEDAAQRVFLRLLEEDAWRKIVNPRKYFRRAARNQALNALRDLRIRHRYHDAAHAGNRHVDALRDLLRQEARERLQQLLLALPRRCSAVMLATIVEGLSRRQVAERLGIGVGGVEKQITRGYRLLREMSASSELREVLSTLRDGGG